MLIRECTNECSVCVWVTVVFGEIFVVSIYCQLDVALEPYLANIDVVYTSYVVSHRSKLQPSLSRECTKCAKRELHVSWV